MKKKLLFFFVPFLLLCQRSNAQNTNINGIINQFSKVTNVDLCNNSVTVLAPSKFQVGKKVLIIQMQGVEVTTTDNAQYGDITDYKEAGNYEILKVKSISGNTLTFDFEITKNYNPAGSVQLIPLPEYATATITSDLTTQAWDGSEGGVLLLKADSIIMNDSIKLSGLGFRGFFVNDSSGSSNVNCLGPTSYKCTDSLCGAIKGEGVLISNINYGRGKNANGGGGGNDHNAGGGGGGNYGAGGIGGTRKASFGCPGNSPGIGGAALTYNNAENKIFMGGAGGCGDGNNWDPFYKFNNTGGASGGGICILIANVLVTNNKAIISTGIDVSKLAYYDAAGAGGAGGTILLDVNSIIGNLAINTNGGYGGSVRGEGNLTNQCWGPGGGGGGGMLWLKQASIPANISYTSIGGVSGINTLNNLSCPGSANGALAGNNGGSLMQLTILESSKTFEKLTASFSKDTTVCPNQQVNLFANASSSGTISYSWSTGENIPQISVYPTASATYKVTVTDDNNCRIDGLINVASDFFPAILSPSKDTSICKGNSVEIKVLTNATGTVNYNWSSGEKTSQITVSPTSPQTYSVTVDNGSTCNTVKTITISLDSIIASVTSNQTICPNNVVNLEASTTSTGIISYSWSTGEKTAQIAPNPQNSQTYTVTVSNENGCSTVKNISVTVDSNASNLTPQITALPDSALSIGQTVQLTATPTNAAFYSWSGDNSLSASDIYNPSANPQKTTQYCVKVTDATNCFKTVCKIIEVINPTPQIAIPDAFTPNSDGKNDLFKVITTGSSVVYEMKIYNRWGELVFEENSNVGWNGNYNGIAQASETYLCKVVYGTSLDTSKKINTMKSFVLIR